MKIETSSFSGAKIHPGRGMRFIRGDGRVFYFRTAKERCYFNQNQKNAKFAWTTVYRKVHKKGIASQAGRRRVKRVVKVQRQVYGLDHGEVAKKRTESKARRKGRAATEVKERKAARKAQQKVVRNRGPIPHGKASKKFNARSQNRNFS
eukprot:TRINITY_DN215_c0_g1_i2.p1 TRINITY_DN215_c0_g1~~TRINITY_DN215_c0_g1_i2.p1  ORF type:complete len:149 (-),score=30.91 TRINITY_DN215_c0_g1_i2:45-491(-)